MKKARAAVIGCGSISVMHGDSAIALAEAELVAVCDLKKKPAVRACAGSKDNENPFVQKKFTI